MSYLWSKASSLILKDLCYVFGEVNYRKVICRLCNQVIYEGSSAGGTMLSYVYRHFRAHHPEVYVAYLEKAKQEASSIRAQRREHEKMVLISFHLPKSMLDELDELVKMGKFPNRSEAIRVAIRDLILREKEAEKKRLRSDFDVPIVPGR